MRTLNAWGGVRRARYVTRMKAMQRELHQYRQFGSTSQVEAQTLRIDALRLAYSLKFNAAHFSATSEFKNITAAQWRWCLGERKENGKRSCGHMHEDLRRLFTQEVRLQVIAWAERICGDRDKGSVSLPQIDPAMEYFVVYARSLAGTLARQFGVYALYPDAISAARYALKIGGLVLRTSDHAVVFQSSEIENGARIKAKDLDDEAPLRVTVLPHGWMFRYDASIKFLVVGATGVLQVFHEEADAIDHAIEICQEVATAACAPLRDYRVSVCRAKDGLEVFSTDNVLHSINRRLRAIGALEVGGFDDE